MQILLLRLQMSTHGVFVVQIFITVKHDLIHLQMYQEAHIVSILKKLLIFKLYLLVECV